MEMCSVMCKLGGHTGKLRDILGHVVLLEWNTIPGDTPPVSDRCKRSAACRADPEVDLSTLSHLLEGFYNKHTHYV